MNKVNWVLQEDNAEIERMLKALTTVLENKHLTPGTLGPSFPTRLENNQTGNFSGEVKSKHVTGLFLDLDRLFSIPVGWFLNERKGLEEMPRLTMRVAEDTLRKEIQKLDKRVQLLAVNEAKKKDAYRVTLLKDGRTGSAKIKKDVVREYLAGEGKGNELRRALGKAVSHLSIRYRK